ncbi:MAG: carbon-nitrogen hydrolase, partial [Acidobacteriota bacterium]
RDPTLTFQLRHGFRVLGVVSDYLKNDPESLGHAALIEWLNPALATAEDYAQQERGFRDGFQAA